MCGNAVGASGPEGDAAGDDAVDVVAGEPRRAGDDAGTDELIGGNELATTADDELTGATSGELTDAVGPATCGEVDVHALRQKTAPVAIAATHRVGPVTKEECPGRPRRTRSAIRKRWPSGTRSACPFLRPSR